MNILNLFKQKPRVVNSFKTVKNGFIEARIESEQGKILSEIISLLQTGENKMLVLQKLETLSVKITDVSKVDYRVISGNIYLWINI